MGDIMNSTKGVRSCVPERDILYNVCQIMKCMTFPPTNATSMSILSSRGDKPNNTLWILNGE